MHFERSYQEYGKTMKKPSDSTKKLFMMSSYLSMKEWNELKLVIFFYSKSMNFLS